MLKVETQPFRLAPRATAPFLPDPITPLYVAGQAVQVTAIPHSGNYFSSWSNAAIGTDNSLAFVVTSATPTLSCLFASLPPGEFALTLRANGGGRVTSDPPGNKFLRGQQITIKATSDTNQEFVGWSGDASGTEPSFVVVVEQSYFISANFTKRPRFSFTPCLGGVREDGFHLALTGPPGTVYEIDESPSTMEWTPFAMLTNLFGTVGFTAPATTSGPSRFYRAVVMP